MILGLAVFGATMTTSPVWGDILDHHFAQWARRGGAGRLVDPLAHCAEGRHGFEIGGVMKNFFNNLMGAIAPAVTGFVVGATNSFSLAFLVAGVVLLIGIFFFVVVLGKIKPIPEPDAVAAAPAPA